MAQTALNERYAVGKNGAGPVRKNKSGERQEDEYRGKRDAGRDCCHDTGARVGAQVDAACIGQRGWECSRSVRLQLQYC